MRRPRLRLGFRARVIGFAGVTTIGALAIGLLLGRAVLLERLDRDVAAALDQEVREMRELSRGNDPETAQPFADNVAALFNTFLVRNIPGPGEAYLTFVEGRLHNRSSSALVLDGEQELLDGWADLTEGQRGEVDTEAGPVRYVAIPLQSEGRTAGVFVVTHALRERQEAIESDIRISALAVAVVGAVTMAIAWTTAGRLLRPLKDVTDAARSIGETDLSLRIPVEGNDEVADLAVTFNQMLDRLETSFATQRAFVDDAGHELRTPITIVMGQLELMGDDPDDRAATLKVVDDELARMARIVEDLLVLAKAEQPDFVRLEDVELADLTTELLAKARTLGAREWSLDTCATGPVRLDGQRVTQAILNLARNAVEHTEPGTAVAIGSARDGDRVRLWVRDEGDGVAEADRERIFERFSRGRHARRRSEGAGLGLAIAQAVATAHHGRVTLSSPPGEGATFTLDLSDGSKDHPGAEPTGPAGGTRQQGPTERDDGGT